MQHKTNTDKTEQSKQIEELSRLTGELAHEIKNPLSVIKVNLKLIREELQDANFSPSGKGSESCSKAMRKLAVIEKETDRLEQILDGFLQYVSRTELQLVSADINEVVDDMVDFYSPQAQGRKITIRQSLCREALVCRVDVNMLKQAILNLLINAQQAMSNGGELLIRTERQNNDAVIQIGDTGSGIAPDRLAHIFDGYYSSRPRGSGLGLPTTRKIVQAHNGSISVNSEEGKGTLFTIKLPLESK
jgi:signal transduction histidine kinase